MNLRRFIDTFGAWTAVCGALCCLALGCGPGLVPPSADAAKTPTGGPTGTTSDAGAFGSDNPSQVTGTAGAGGSGSLPNSAGAGTTAPPAPNDADAGSEDAGAEP